ncbi:MAG: SET domain-containing protein [Pirellulales bacterium]
MKKKSHGRRRRKQAVCVKESRVGQGVFACRAFGSDEVIGQIRGEIIDDADYHSDYCMELENDLVIEPDDPFRCLNHSCQPNCELFQWESKGRVECPDELWVHALQVILPGEELTIDYGWPADEAISCLCGASNCRGWIVAEDQLYRIGQPSVA